MQFPRLFRDVFLVCFAFVLIAFLIWIGMGGRVHAEMYDATTDPELKQEKGRIIIGNEPVIIEDEKGRYVKGEVTIKFKDTATEDQINTLIRMEKLKQNGPEIGQGYFSFIFTDDRDTRSVVAEISSMKDIVESAEVNGIMKLQSLPNDPGMCCGPTKNQHYMDQIHMTEVFTTMEPLHMISNPPTIGSCDDGLQYGHIDFNYSQATLGCNQIYPNYSPCIPATNTSPTVHAMQGMCLIACISNNDYQGSGITNNVRFLVDKACNDFGGCPDVAVARCINHLATQGVVIIVLPVGYYVPSSALSSALAGHPQIVYLCSAGDDGLYTLLQNQTFYPAGYPQCIVFTGLDQYDNLCSICNWGEADLSGPATDIAVTLAAGSESMQKVKGTSLPPQMAAALLVRYYDRCGGATGAEMKAALLNTADTIGCASYVCGKKINALRMEQYPCPIRYLIEAHHDRVVDRHNR